MQRLLILVGSLIIVIGLLWPWLARLPFGRLPGDFFIEREGVHFYFPLTTGLLVSAVISLVLWFLRR